MRLARRVRLEGVGLAAGAVESDEQLPVEALPVRVLHDERLELLDEPRIATGAEVRLDPLLEHEDPQLVQAGELAAHAVWDTRRVAATPRQSERACLSSAAVAEPLRARSAARSNVSRSSSPGSTTSSYPTRWLRRRS